MPETSTENAKSAPLERYFGIIEALCAFPKGLSLNEIADMLVLPKQSAHRLLVTMQASDLVTVTSGRGQTYTIGNRVKKISLLSADESWVQSMTKSVLQRLSTETGETSYIAKLEGHLVRSVAMESPDTPWRGFVLPGKFLQPHATASAKAIMAFQSQDVINKALSGRLQKLTRHTLTSKVAVEAEYKRIRENGYGTCIGEVDENLAAVAVPITVGNLGVLFSLGLVGPLPRITKLIKNDVYVHLGKHAKAIASTLEKGQE